MINATHTNGNVTRPIGAYKASTRSRAAYGRLGRAKASNPFRSRTKCVRVNHEYSALGSTTVRTADSSVSTTSTTPATMATTRTTSIPAFLPAADRASLITIARVLIRLPVLQQIASGEIDTLFRRQK